MSSGANLFGAKHTDDERAVFMETHYPKPRPDDADPAGLYLLVAIWIGAVVLTVLYFNGSLTW